MQIYCVQPDEQTAEMHILFDVSFAAHIGMVKAVEAKFAKRRAK